MVVAWKAEDLRAAEAADGKEPAHKVHAGGPKKAKPNEFSSFDDPRAFYSAHLRYGADRRLRLFSGPEVPVGR